MLQDYSVNSHSKKAKTNTCFQVLALLFVAKWKFWY
jgi:hypothetical protein